MTTLSASNDIAILNQSLETLEDTLLRETLSVILSNNQHPNNIAFIGSLKTGHSCTWEEFCILANTEYDDGYGSANVCTDLTIVFSNNDTMTREEYDGSEWWKFNLVPSIPENQFQLNNLFIGNYRDTLAENNPDAKPNMRVVNDTTTLIEEK